MNRQQELLDQIEDAEAEVKWEKNIIRIVRTAFFVSIAATIGPNFFWGVIPDAAIVASNIVFGILLFFSTVMACTCLHMMSEDKEERSANARLRMIQRKYRDHVSGMTSET